MSVEKYSANYLQGFYSIFSLVLPLCIANLIFSCWPVSPTYCITQFEHVIKYIGSITCYVRLFIIRTRKVLRVTELTFLSVDLKKIC